MIGGFPVRNLLQDGRTSWVLQWVIYHFYKNFFEKEFVLCKNFIGRIMF